ncbi:hypothetical protein Ciccas_000440 [Cichlidogyrus casuarinus]|uniref:Uncharacterized protein n=1 Tax=Cichlidogyrus casuarinus TaxID=1844966 RepID=A0ABD2QMX2_9PLAT
MFSYPNHRITVLARMEDSLISVVAALQDRYQFKINVCEYFLNDKYQLLGEAPLSQHCIYETGVAQLVLEAITHDAQSFLETVTKINVLDVQYVGANELSAFKPQCEPLTRVELQKKSANKSRHITINDAISLRDVSHAFNRLITLINPTPSSTDPMGIREEEITSLKNLDWQVI